LTTAADHSDLGSLHDFYRAVILHHQHDLELGKNMALTSDARARSWKIMAGF
jgi:hypothetical protein